MTPQEIQLLSDAVKIGFPVIGTVAGAIIGGVSTYFIAKINHRYDALKDSRNKRLELIMQVANDATEFEHVSGIYATAISNRAQGLKVAVDFAEAQSNVHQKSQSLRRARMALKILGLKKAEEELEKYIQLTREIARNHATLPKERIIELAKTISRGPTEFYTAIAKEIEPHHDIR